MFAEKSIRCSKAMMRRRLIAVRSRGGGNGASNSDALSIRCTLRPTQPATSWSANKYKRLFNCTGKVVNKYEVMKTSGLTIQCHSKQLLTFIVASLYYVNILLLVTSGLFLFSVWLRILNSFIARSQINSLLSGQTQFWEGVKLVLR